MTETITQEHYDYLDLLRESGVTNMFGAAPYLQEAFDLTKQESIQILGNWMKQFKG